MPKRCLRFFYSFLLLLFKKNKKKKKSLAYIFYIQKHTHMYVLISFFKMTNSLKEEFLLQLKSKNFGIILDSFLVIIVALFIFKQWQRRGRSKSAIPGRLGLPFLGETFAFLSATNSTHGCYNFVKLRRLWYVCT